jgi:hypothetical protein
MGASRPSRSLPVPLIRTDYARRGESCAEDALRRPAPISRTADPLLTRWGPDREGLGLG